MKKIIIVLLSLLVLCGCSKSSYSHISNGDDVIYEKPNGEVYTKEELYQYEKKFAINDAIVSTLVCRIAEKEGIDIKDIEKNATAYIDDLINQGYSDFVNYYYGSRDAYIKDSTNFTAKQKLLAKYVEDNFDNLVNEYEPFKASIIFFDNEDTCNSILNYMNENNSSFAYACTINGYSSEVTENIYTTANTDIPNEISNWINSNDKGTSSVIKVSTVTNDLNGNSNSVDRYYIVNLVSKDVNDFKDDFIDSMTSVIDENLIINNLIKKHNIHVYDQDIYDVLHDRYEGIK